MRASPALGTGKSPSFVKPAMIDADYLRMHYSRLDDEELRRLYRGELVPEARSVLQAEISARGISAATVVIKDASEPVQPSDASDTNNPYSPPGAVVADPESQAAVIKVSGLIRLFQWLVVTSTLLGLLLFGWPFLPIPLTEELATLRSQAGAGAIAFAVNSSILLLLQPLWILSAVGLCFFKWWARPIFAGTYGLLLIGNLLGGVAIWLPWETVLITVTTLLDGAVLALAFLPPLSEYFARDRP